jgi:hypothetical protein
LAKRAELRNTFMDLAEQYRVLAWKVKALQKEHSSSAKLLVEKIAAQRLAERLTSFGAQNRLALSSSRLDLVAFRPDELRNRIHGIE